MAKIFDMGRDMKFEDFTFTTDTIHLTPPPELPPTPPVRVSPVTWVGGPHTWPEPQQVPTIEELLRSLTQTTVPADTVTIPAGLEMVRGAEVGEIVGNYAKLVFHINGPTIPRALLKELPPSIMRRLDYELKLAVIRAFDMKPVDPERKRTLILDSEE